MESMKMETAITAPRDGVIAKLGFDKGQSFERDAVLVALEPLATTAAAKTESRP
jgi:biotin carboxyl carrier protein